MERDRWLIEAGYGQGEPEQRFPSFEPRPESSEPPYRDRWMDDWVFTDLSVPVQVRNLLKSA